ncbi:Multidrug resistance protein fnx1 [Fusarium oxysporum f. sp. albedinis]|nr:Multidrug resistance protein fnx1 [Fusarium oxysporum f. sp. albedinis]
MNFSVYRTSSNIQEDIGMKAAMWNGFSPFTARQNLKPAFACATGNCTWANFTSIAVCSKCRDISGYVTKSSGPVKLPSGI